MDWARKEIWSKRAPSFAVEVSRHEVPETVHPDDGPHRWAVYAYVYPTHPLFATIDAKGGIWQDATVGMPLHVGCSLLRTHRGEDGAVCSYQIGADYHHLYDAPFTYLATREEAPGVFADAEELFRYLENGAKP